MRDTPGGLHNGNLLDCTAFVGNEGVPGIALTGWKSWAKPRNASLIYFLLFGGGGGGGGGQTAAAGSNRTGGGAGSSGGFSRLIIPAFMLPDTLWCQPGLGGVGGAANTTGNPGQQTSVSLLPNDLQFPFATANGGNQGTSGGGGGAGGASPAATGILQLAQFGFFTGTAGNSGGGGGGPGVTPAPLTWGGSSIPICGGTGGGGVDNTNTDKAGGDISTIPLLGNTNPHKGGVAAAGGGQKGIALGGGLALSSADIAAFFALNKNEPFIFTGGTGGGTAGAAGVAGAGGNGETGCGGGGGGAGVTGGAGGNGGPGLILIAAW